MKATFAALTLGFTLLSGCNSITAPSGSTLVTFIGRGQAAPSFPFTWKDSPYLTNAEGQATLTGPCGDHSIIAPSARYTGWSFTQQEINTCDPSTIINLTLIDIPARPHQ